ncbi:MAG TPA: phosphoribosylanthranilate isomerase [Desulfobacteria bacterium]|nr:phosphoribosylanthranilate isomerase [Desulfobacteria bacterium]
MTRVKICGIKTLEAAHWAVEAGADALGFVFAPSARQINPERAREIILSLPPFVTKVGVFVNEQRYIVEELGTFCKLDVLQFHGTEPPEYCRRWSYQVIKGFAVGDDWEPSNLEKYDVDAFLLDTKVEGKAGGSGKTFNWAKAEGAKQFGKPIILAGGLNPDNIAAAIEQVHPYAVDVSSGVEQDGEKSRELIYRFTAETRRSLG